MPEKKTSLNHKKHHCLRAHRWLLPGLSLLLLRLWKCFSFDCERVRAIVVYEKYRLFNSKNVWNRSKINKFLSLSLPYRVLYQSLVLLVFSFDLLIFLTSTVFFSLNSLSLSISASTLLSKCKFHEVWWKKRSRKSGDSLRIQMFRLRHKRICLFFSLYSLLHRAYGFDDLLTWLDSALNSV